MKFHAVLLEGLFFASPQGDLQVQTETGEIIPVLDRLLPLVGQQVQLAVHHLPSGGVDPSAWGWGSCQWKPAECPAGHHTRPNFLFSFSGNGVLLQDPWRLDLSDGGTSPIDFAVMPGHHGRLAAATVPDIEKLKDELIGLDAGVLGAKVDELQEMLRKLSEDKTK